MSKMIGAPTRYRQGKDELKCLGDDLKDCIVSLEVAMNDSESNTTILYRDRQKVLDSFSYVVSDVIKNEKNINHITGFLDVMKGL